MAPPFRIAEFDILPTRYIRHADLVNTGVIFGVVVKAGAFVTFGEQKLGQGLAAPASSKDKPKIEKDSEQSKGSSSQGGVKD